MLKSAFRAVLIFTALAVSTTAFAGASTFQNSCSNITFAYVNNQAAVQAVCLKADGTANSSTLVITGISNQQGKLVQGSGASTFQSSCGNIQITANASGVTLSALCRNSSGASGQTSLPLSGIGNNNGNLSY